MQISSGNLLKEELLVCMYGVPSPKPKLKQFGVIASIVIAAITVIIGIGVIVKKKIKRKKEKQNGEDVEK